MKMRFKKDSDGQYTIVTNYKDGTAKEKTFDNLMDADNYLQRQNAKTIGYRIAKGIKSVQWKIGKYQGGGFFSLPDSYLDSRK
jgi:hypothetical protein